MTWMTERSNPTGPAETSALIGREATAERAVRQGPLRPRWRRQVHYPVIDPVLAEEEAIARLYGERTGTVNPSPAQPPLPGARRAPRRALPADED
jgi:hypothetical protein